MLADYAIHDTSKNRFSVVAQAIRTVALSPVFYVFPVAVISIMTGLVVIQKIAAFQDLINVPDRLIIAVQIPPLWMKCIFPEAG
ncbi:hypothetical protein BN1182_AA_01100 [Pantoea ananatis]|nr:hypothetical protein BN1182_AA_01100 [Pantoea ananatis]